MQDIPFWMTMLFSPGILWIVLFPLLCSVLSWKFVFGNVSDTIEQADRRAAIRRTWVTGLLCNIISCVVLLIIEYMMRMVMDTDFKLLSLTIWNSPFTIVVYAIPVIVSFFVIFTQFRRYAYYLLADRTPAKIASWVIALFATPWYILIPTSLLKDITHLIG